MEVSREQDVSSPVHRQCLSCGNWLELWSNGGEGDRQDCCGYEYSVEAAGMDYVVRVRGDRRDGSAV